MRRDRCPKCDAEVFVAKDADGRRVVLDACTPVYFQARLNPRSGNPVVARNPMAFALHAPLCQLTFRISALAPRRQSV